MVGSRARNAMRLVAAGAALLSLSLVPATAGADAVPPPPTNCPDGTTGMTCHGGQYCQPSPCKSNADCSGGQVCLPRAFCLGHVTCGGGIFPPDGSPSTVAEPAAGAACASSADCDGGAMCATQSLCVSPGSSGSSGGSSGGSGGGSSGGPTVVQGCSCEVAGGESGADRAVRH